MLDVAGGLAESLFVLDQRDADIAFAVFAEPDSRRYRDIGLFQQELRERQRTAAVELLRNRRPGEHRRWRRRNRPTGLVQAFDQNIATLLVASANLLDALL